MTNTEKHYLKWMLVIGLGAAIVMTWGCAGQSPRKSLKAAHEVIYDFDQRTGRLCLGASPIKTKAECLDRLDASERAQRALNNAQTAVLACEDAEACPAGDIAWTIADTVLRELETYVYQGAK